MTGTAAQTVRDLVLERPVTARIFEKFHIDYCGGSRPLVEACAAAGVDVETVVGLLEALAETPGQNREAMHFQAVSLTALRRHIVETHHRLTRQEMGRLKALIEKVCAAHGRNHLELLGIKPLFQALRHDLEPHMLKGEGATPADTGNTGRGTVCAMHDCGSVWRW